MEHTKQSQDEFYRSYELYIQTTMIESQIKQTDIKIDFDCLNKNN